MKKYIIELLGESEFDGFSVVQIGTAGQRREKFIVPHEIGYMLQDAINNVHEQEAARSPIEAMRDGVFTVRQPAQPAQPHHRPDRHGSVHEPVKAHDAKPAQAQPARRPPTGRTEPVATPRAALPASREARAAAIGSDGVSQPDVIFDKNPNRLDLQDICSRWTDSPRSNRDLIEREVARVGVQNTIRYVKQAGKAGADGELEAHILNALLVVAGGHVTDVHKASTAGEKTRRRAGLSTDTRDVQEGNPAGLRLPDPASYIAESDEDDTFA